MHAGGAHPALNRIVRTSKGPPPALAVYFSLLEHMNLLFISLISHLEKDYSGQRIFVHYPQQSNLSSQDCCREGEELIKSNIYLDIFTFFLIKEIMAG